MITSPLRKRLRSVCNEELPWRTQANLALASCYLNQALGRLKAECTEGTHQEDRLPRNRLGFESTGVIIDGVISSFPEVIAGCGKTQGQVRGSELHGLTLLKEVLHCMY